MIFDTNSVKVRHSLFFLLANCPFVSRVISFIYHVRVRGDVVSMFNETSHSFFVWGSSRASLRCRIVVTAVLNGLYRVHGLRVSSLCPVAHWHYLPPLSFEKVLLFSLFPPSFSPCVLPLCVCVCVCGLLAISYPLVSLPDWGSHFVFLLSSAFVYIPMIFHR